jgi:hypothetical protein
MRVGIVITPEQIGSGQVVLSCAHSTKPQRSHRLFLTQHTPRVRWFEVCVVLCCVVLSCSALFLMFCLRFLMCWCDHVRCGVLQYVFEWQRDVCPEEYSLSAAERAAHVLITREVPITQRFAAPTAKNEDDTDADADTDTIPLACGRTVELGDELVLTQAIPFGRIPLSQNSYLYITAQHPVSGHLLIEDTSALEQEQDKEGGGKRLSTVVTSARTSRLGAQFPVRCHSERVSAFEERYRALMSSTSNAAAALSAPPAALHLSLPFHKWGPFLIRRSLDVGHDMGRCVVSVEVCELSKEALWELLGTLLHRDTCNLICDYADSSFATFALGKCCNERAACDPACLFLIRRVC